MDFFFLWLVAFSELFSIQVSEGIQLLVHICWKGNKNCKQQTQARRDITKIDRMTVYHDEVEIEDFEYDEDEDLYTYPCVCFCEFDLLVIHIWILFKLVVLSVVSAMWRRIYYYKRWAHARFGGGNMSQLFAGSQSHL